ncbi:uncharacterized protein V6R79_021186 [Siganus canaliculatus]
MIPEETERALSKALTSFTSKSLLDSAHLHEDNITVTYGNRETATGGPARTTAARAAQPPSPPATSTSVPHSLLTLLLCIQHQTVTPLKSGGGGEWADKPGVLMQRVLLEEEDSRQREHMINDTLAPMHT